MLEEYHLEFHSLAMAEPHVFLRAAHPLAKRSSVTTADLEPYPFLCFEQGVHNSFYFAEELLSTVPHKKSIRVSDRATLFNLLRGVNGYTICSGVISEALNGPNIRAVPLLVDDSMQIGYLTHKQVQPGRFGKQYIAILKKYTEQV